MTKLTLLEELLRAASRTFAIGIERLPGQLQDAVQIAYLLLRVSDYLEDNEEMQPEQKAELLHMWDQVLAGELELHELMAQLTFPEEITPDALVAKHTPQVIAALNRLPDGLRNPIIKHVRDSTQGMARWALRGPDVVTEDDLDDYMHEVAGRVGYLLTNLFAWYSFFIWMHKDRLMPLAREFGLALQTVNVIRGLRDDYERGWIFVPESFVEEYGIAREALFDEGNEEIAMAVLDRLVEKAERHLAAARAYLKALPPWHHAIRLFCIFPLFFAVRTLALSRANYAVFTSEAKISRDEVKQIVRDSTLWAWSNRWVDDYARQLAVID